MRARRSKKKNDTGLSKKWLAKEIRKEDKRKKKEALVILRADLRRAGAARKTAMRTGVTECRRARLASKRRCRVGVDRYKTARSAWLAALEHLRSEMKYRREMRILERGVREREKEKRARGTLAKAEPRETDDDVRANIPHELEALFDKVRKGIKGGPRRSRTEEFLEYAHKHPEEVFEDTEAIYEKAAREGAARQAMPNPRGKFRIVNRWGAFLKEDGAFTDKKRRAASFDSRKDAIRWRDSFSHDDAKIVFEGGPRKKKNPRGFSKKEARRKYRLDHWGRGGNRAVSKMTAPAIVRASSSAKAKASAKGIEVRTRSAPDPKRGVLVELGYELAAFEFKDARDGRRMRIRLPEKIRPRLAYNASGLVVVGGSYAPPAVARDRKLPHGVLVELGELRQISYVTRKGLDPKIGVEYFHTFGRPRPALAYGAGGWVILGGSYRVTARGIVG